MKKLIIPAIIAKNQKELSERLNRVKDLSTIIHLDVMDGKFVENRSLQFNPSLPRRKKYWTHLMMEKPSSWIRRYWKKVDGFILHWESYPQLDKLIEYLKKRKKKIGLAINPKTKPKLLKPFLNKVDLILIMTVYPGKYGSKFLSGNLRKVKKLRKLGFEGTIALDGGLNPTSLPRASKTPANQFVIGSYLQDSRNPKKAIKELKEAITETN